MGVESRVVWVSIGGAYILVGSIRVYGLGCVQKCVGWIDSFWVGGGSGRCDVVVGLGCVVIIVVGWTGKMVGQCCD